MNRKANIVKPKKSKAIMVFRAGLLCLSLNIMTRFKCKKPVYSPSKRIFKSVFFFSKNVAFRLPSTIAKGRVKATF